MINIDKLLEKTLEIEGVLRLLQTRAADDFTVKMLLNKARELTSLFEESAKGDVAMLSNGVDPVISAGIPVKVETPTDSSAAQKEDEKDSEEVDNNEETSPEICIDDNYTSVDEDNVTVLEIAIDGAEELQGRAKMVVADLVQSFTLNDRYRFTQELFDNNREEFDETLNVLAEMDGFEEAEDYLLNDMGWDASNPIVEEFLQILSNNK